MSAQLPPPGLPREDPTLSFWLSRSRDATLLGHRTTPDLPTTASTVIIGSGFSGAVIAKTLYDLPGEIKEGDAPVVMLEARDVCSGATGRNGGHTRPDRFRGYSMYKRLWGAEQAIKIIHNERDNLQVMRELVQGIDCDAWFGTTFEVWAGEEALAAGTSSYAEFVADGGDISDITMIRDSAEAARVTRVKNALSAASLPAGSVFPFRLVHGILTALIARGLNLQTFTPAHSIKPSPLSTAERPLWDVVTPRGTITTPRVIHATNGFAATLLPQLHGFVEPWRGQCSAHIPPASFAGPKKLGHTMVVRTSLTEIEYLMQRPADGTVIMGGARSVDEKFNNNTDDTVVLEGMTKHLTNYLPNALEGWVPKAVNEGMHQTWTGILGYTKDAVPLIGAVPGLPGQFSCVGFQGHGMARIATSARGAALVAAGRPWSETNLPECFEITKERLADTTKDVIAETVAKHVAEKAWLKV
ncbi:hypothetical protein PLICRDRAFT_173346 [Plicaturopsis crispa FD-325 SS-3]|nr:hypothetical protein PLICRDRAFT_173346 [Plicaturopsis crispa FD-325 SS-3]